MKTKTFFAVTFVIACWALEPPSARSQITITSADMFNQIGQYYRAYANSNGTTVNVSGLLGNTGGSQAWNFASGPQGTVYRYDYLGATNGPSGTDFFSAGARIVEQQTDESDSSKSWVYFAQDPIKGKLDYGFYSPASSSSQPAAFFSPALQDFPATIRYGDSWQGQTVYESTFSSPLIGDIPERVTYTSMDKVDAYGVVITPSFGFLDCLRVHELVQYDTAFDLGDGSGYQNLETDYLINYYWLAPGHGIVVQITSVGSNNGPPPDTLPGGAAQFVRMFETNHGDGAPPPPNTIQNFQVSTLQWNAQHPNNAGLILTWTQLASVSSYRVDYSTNFVDPSGWRSLGTTTGNFMIDSSTSRTNAPARYYRVVGLN